MMLDKDKIGKCIWCGSERLERLEQAQRTFYATGDRKTIQVDQTKAYRVICQKCGNIQFLHNKYYKDVVEHVFEEYGKMNDYVWSEKGGVPRLRKICELIEKNITLKEVGKILDIGCGNGDFLRYFHEIRPEWELYGQDVGVQFIEAGNDGMMKFYSSISEIEKEKQKYDFISVNATLSLADNVCEILSFIKNNISDDGIGFIMETDFEVMPWENYEIDSRTLLTRSGLNRILDCFGFDICGDIFESGMKESGVYFENNNKRQTSIVGSYEENKRVYENNIIKIDDYMNLVAQWCSNNEYYGIFGTSIAGKCLLQFLRSMHILDENIFFIEEDETACGEENEGIKVWHPKDVKERAIVFLPFPEYISKNIIARMRENDWLDSCELI